MNSDYDRKSVLFLIEALTIISERAEAWNLTEDNVFELKTALNAIADCQKILLTR